MIGIEYYYPTEEQVNNMGRIALSTRCKKLLYKKIGDEYLAYHPSCGVKKMINKKLMEQVKGTHLCPFCYEEIQSTSDKNVTAHEFIRFIKPTETFGYYVLCEYDVGTGNLYTDYEQVLYASGDDCYHRYLGTDLFANYLSIQPWKEDWKYSKRYHTRNYYANSSTYEDPMWDYEWALGKIKSPINKKDYLELNMNFIEKSNQKKIAIDNLITPTMAEFMKVFDLNNAEDIYKYRTYMEKNKSHIKDFINHKIFLNVYYLDYLKRNKINLGDYYVFLNNLETLGFKYEKPKDFKFRSEKVEEMAIVEKDKELNSKIEKRCNSLPSYTKNNFEIHPFKTANEIRRCGKQLHNCIGGYVDKYSNGITDIYHLDCDGEIVGALEIRKNKLIQAHEDYNRPMSVCHRDIVNEFCNANNIALH